LSPEKSFRWVRRILLVVVAVMVVQLIAGIEIRKVDADDYSTPAAPPGTVLLVRSVDRDDGELQAESLYFAAYEWPAGSGQAALRLVRLVGLPGEEVMVTDGMVNIGGRNIPARPKDVLGWPEKIADGKVLVLTDEPNVVPPRGLHSDSRRLGPIDRDRLQMRVTAIMPF